MSKELSGQTVAVVVALLKTLVKYNVIAPCELRCIEKALNKIAEEGEEPKVEKPSLLSREDICEMFNIEVELFKRLEREGKFPFKPIYISQRTIRYLESEVMDYITAKEESTTAA